MDKVKFWFLMAVVTAFISFILFMQVDSYHADKAGLNITYIAFGVVFALGALFSIFKAKSHS